MADKKRIPTMPFNTKDWLKSKATRKLSLADKGLLVDVLCYMWGNTECGVMAGEDIGRFDKAALERLLETGALGLREDGALYSPRILKLLDISAKRSLAGRKGGETTKAQGFLAQAAEMPSEEPKDEAPAIIQPNAETCDTESAGVSGEDSTEKTELVLFPEVVEEVKSKTELELSALKEQFEEFRKAYKGTKRGFQTELANLQKRYPKEWKQIIPLLLPALTKFIAWREASEGKIFVPQWANLSTWINQRRWENEYEQTNKSDNGIEWQTNQPGGHEADDSGIPGAKNNPTDGDSQWQGNDPQKDYSERF